MSANVYLSDAIADIVTTAIEKGADGVDIDLAIYPSTNGKLIIASIPQEHSSRVSMHIELDQYSTEPDSND